MITSKRIACARGHQLSQIQTLTEDLSAMLVPMVLDYNGWGGRTFEAFVETSTHDQRRKFLAVYDECAHVEIECDQAKAILDAMVTCMIDWKRLDQLHNKKHRRAS